MVRGTQEHKILTDDFSGCRHEGGEAVLETELSSPGLPGKDEKLLLLLILLANV